MRFLTVPEAAEYLGLSCSTLNKLRMTGDGPKYYKLGKPVRYLLDDLTEWALSRSYASTVQYIRQPVIWSDHHRLADASSHSETKQIDESARVGASSASKPRKRKMREARVIVTIDPERRSLPNSKRDSGFPFSSLQSSYRISSVDWPSFRKN